jgi:hypothetical protein
MTEIERGTSLPSVRETGEFEGAEHGSDVSVIVVDAEPGRGPALNAGAIEPSRIVTHRFPLDDHAAAFEALRGGGEDGAPRGKVVLELGAPRTR